MTLADIAAALGIAGTGLSAIKTGTEIIQGAKELVSGKDPDLLALKQKLSDLYDELIIAKKAQMTMQDTLLKLQDEAKQAEAFDAEAHRYVMTRTSQGATIYSLRPDEARGEPLHDLCPNCFQNKKKSMLQPVAMNTLGCNICGGTFLKPDGQQHVFLGPVGRRSFDPI